MPLSKKLHADFSEANFYHVICKAIDGKKLFLSDENKSYFLKRYLEFTFDFVDTYCYCLLDNHVHFIIRTKSDGDILENISNLSPEIQTQTHRKFIQKECSFHELVEQQFNRFFIAYSLAYNKQNNIKSHLFSRPFKRIEVNDNNHLTQLFVYVHANAMKHGLVKDFITYKWSSYNAIISASPTNLKRNEVLEWFGGKEQFFKAHKEMAEFYSVHDLSGE